MGRHRQPGHAELRVPVETGDIPVTLLASGRPSAVVDLHCRSCRHWHPEAESATLRQHSGAPPDLLFGECWGTPPDDLRRAPWYYYRILPGDCPACGRHQC